MIKKFVFVIFLSCCFFSVYAFENQTDSAKSFSAYIDGMMKFEIFQDYDGAIIDLTKAINIGESSKYVFSTDLWAKTILQDYYKNRGKSYYMIEEYDNAQKDFSAYISLKETYWDIDASDYFNRGNCYFKIEQYENAIFDYNSGLKLETNYTYIANRALCHYSLENYKNAIDDFTKVIDNGQYQFYEMRGRSFLQISKFFSALTDFNASLDIKEDPEIIFLKACSYAMLNSSDQACSNFKKACNLGFYNACEFSEQKDGVCFPKKIVKKQPTRTKNNNGSNNSKIQLPIINEGNMKFISVTVGNKNYKYLIDTGASDMIINSEMESYLLRSGYLRYSDYREPRVYEIANGQKIQLKIAKLSHIKIGNYKFKDIDIAIGDQNASLLLGMSFLNRFDWKFNSNTIELDYK